MNLTIYLNEKRVDKATNKPCGGLATFKDIKSLKVEYCPSTNNSYKVEVILFLGDKYNKQLITLDNMEKVVARSLANLIHDACYKNGILRNGIPAYPNLPKPTYEYEESYMSPENIGVEFMHDEYRQIINRYLKIFNEIDKVSVDIDYNVQITKKEPSEEVDKDSKTVPLITNTTKTTIRSGSFIFGKLNQTEENNPGADYGEIWKQLDDTKYERFMAILNASNKWKGDLEAIKHNTKLSCDKIWKVEISKEDQVQCAVDDITIDPRYIMEIYGGLNGHGDWESYLDGLRTYIKCIKKMPNVYAVNLLETKTDIPDDVFKTLIVVTFDSSKKKKDVNEEIDYRELV